MNSQQEQLFEEIMDRKISQETFLYEGRDENGRWNLIAGLRNYRKYVRAYIDGFSGGRVSNSVFEIVLKEMLEASPRELRPIVMEEEPELTVEQYRAMPVRQIQLKYRNDPAFKAGVEKLIASGQI